MSLTSILGKEAGSLEPLDSRPVRATAVSEWPVFAFHLHNRRESAIHNLASFILYDGASMHARILTPYRYSIRLQMM